jgi:hypothetical protein
MQAVQRPKVQTSKDIIVCLPSDGMRENRGGSLVGGCAPAPARVEEGPTQTPTAYGRDHVKVNQRSRGLGALLWSRRIRFGATTWPKVDVLGSESV